MTRRIIGLDFRTHSITAVKVACGGRSIRVDAHARVPVVPSTGDSGLNDALAILADAVDPTGCECTVSIPAGLAVFRNLRVPFDHPKKIRQILPFELEPALPYAVEDVSIGFRPLALPGIGDTGQTALLAAAVENSHLKAYLDALADVGIRPGTITVGGYAAACWTASNLPQENAFLVDVEGDHCAVFALAGGEVVMVRAFSAIGVNPSTAGTLAPQVRQTCRVMEDMLPGSFDAQAVFLVGAGETDPAPALSKTLGIEVARTDFIRETSGAEGWDAARMDNALALALVEADGLAGVNFQPGPSGFKKAWIENRKALVRTALLAGVTLVLGLAGVWADAYEKQKRLDTLNRQVADVFRDTFPDVRTVVDPLQQMRVKVRGARQQTGGAGGLGTRMRAVDILRQISVSIPGNIDIALGRMVVGPEEVQISGSTDGFDSVDRIKNRLGAATGFRSVSITSATVDKSGGRVQFRMNIGL